MEILISWLLSTVAIIVSAYLLPGVHVDSFVTALVAAAVLGIINAVIKPILVILTLPINILTLGLFLFVINAVCILLVSSVVSGFRIDGFLWALLFGIILSLVNSALHSFIPTE